MASRIFRTLCFDGGGIRGLVTAKLLKALDQANGSAGSISGNADLYAGTSTGSFIALGLAGGKIDIDGIIDVYLNGADLFHIPDFEWTCAIPGLAELEKWLHSLKASEQQTMTVGGIEQDVQGIIADIESVIAAIKGLFMVKYDTTKLEPRLRSLAGTGTLSASPKPVMVNSLMLWPDQCGEQVLANKPDIPSGRWAPVAFGSGSGDPLNAMAAYDAALCSGAAPTYFPPHKPTGFNTYFADGGLFANNPSAAAVGYATQYYGTDASKIRILSIGTGQVDLGIPPDQIGNPECWGAYRWMSLQSHDNGIVPAMPLVQASLGASADAGGEYARMLLSDATAPGGSRYQRLNLHLSQPIPLDGYSKAQIAEMVRLTDSYTASTAFKNWAATFLNFWNG